MLAHVRLAATLALLAVPAAADAATYTVNITGPMDLGSVAAGAAGDTVFRVDPATGSVSVQSGSGRRISTASARAQVNVSCKPARGGDTACDTNPVAIRIGVIGVLTGRARALTNFTVAMGTASLAAPPTGTNPLSFKLAPLGSSGTKSFYVGADFPVAGGNAGLASGDGGNGFYVYTVDAVGLQTAGDTDQGKVRAFRALAAAKTADLNFGTIQRPSSGSNTVQINANSGARSISGTGNAVAFATPAPTRAAFTVTGEGGQQVSVTVPASITLAGPAAIPLSITTDAKASPTLSGTLGGAGTYSFNVGGSFNITTTTPTGAYSATLTVNIDYN